ncbi:hypothetical protein PSACC_01984 [Paramicrosporidium saccamoebae]|uniref:Uncharacterized protein n=1 Tax=Paramicrosporidium saccamoebae TaxID=1246581 RepID=A0A2H9TKE5_9FUNG|nr:hypothetical protein PSACC_01984 [Paramicrosporidium saccamoebae]
MAAWPITDEPCMSRRLYSKNLNLGHFLERRSNFLESISRDAKQSVIQKSQSKLLEILSATGSAVSTKAGLDPTYSPNFNVQTARDAVTIRQMMSCSMHLGHATAKWNPRMAPFIFGERAGIHIIDLEKTIVALRQACNVITDIAARGGVIVFVGTGENIQRLTYECAQECNQHYVNMRWVGGTITNRNQVLRSDKLTPDLLILLDPVTNEMAVQEAQKGNIPTIAICDTNFDPTSVTYPIPANDDAFSSVELVARTLAMAALEGRNTRTQPTKSADIIESATLFIDRVFTREKFKSAPAPGAEVNVAGAEYFEFRKDGNWAQEFAAAAPISEAVAFEQAFSKIEISNNSGWAKEFQGTAAQNAAWINEFSRKTDWPSEPAEGADSWVDEFKSANANEDEELKHTAQGILNSLELDHDSKLQNSRFVAYLHTLAGAEASANQEGRDDWANEFGSTVADGAKVKATAKNWADEFGSTVADGTKVKASAENWADEFSSAATSDNFVQQEFETWKQDFFKNIEPLKEDAQWANMEKAWEEYQGTGYGYENFAQREFGTYHFSVPIVENPYRTVPNKAELLASNVNFKDSILLYEAIVNEDPSNVSAWVQLGTLQQANECDAQAIAAFLKVLASSPSDKDALIGLAASCINESCIPDALEAFQRLLGSAEKGSTIEAILGKFESLSEKSRHYVLATAMLNNMVGNYARAEELLSSVAQDWVTLNRLGASFANAKEYHRAIGIYDQLLSTGHNLPRIHYNKGISLMCLESHDEATRSFIQSIETQIPTTTLTRVKEELLPSYRAPWEALQVNLTIQGREDLASLCLNPNPNPNPNPNLNINLSQIKSAVGL